MSAPATDTPSPLWRRLSALLYDLLAVVAIVMVVGLACQLATGGRLIATDGHARIAWWYQPLQGLVVGAYFVASWLRGGQTLGMRPWRLRVTAGDGKRVSARSAVLRLAVAALPLLALELAPVLGWRGALVVVVVGWALWFAPVLFDRRRRAVHDLVAGTEVRRIG